MLAASTSAVFHGFDLDHGVDVRRGTRYSAIFWFSDGAESCARGTSPWYAARAAAGERDAQAALGELHQIGTRGYAKDAAAAAEWFERAASQGSASSANKLGRMLLAGEGVPRDAARGLRWVEQAAGEASLADIAFMLSPPDNRGEDPVLTPSAPRGRKEKKRGGGVKRPWRPTSASARPGTTFVGGDSHTQHH